MYSTRNDLAEDTRSKVIVILNDRLADMINLALQTKQAHWNVKGPRFIALHELFDSQAALWQEQVDEIAERITALGGVAEGTLTATSARSHLPPYPLDISGGKEHLTALSTSVALMGKLARADVNKTAELGDAGTSDLLTGLSRELDKQLWFLESHLQAEC